MEFQRTEIKHHPDGSHITARKLTNWQGNSVNISEQKKKLRAITNWTRQLSKCR